MILAIEYNGKREEFDLDDEDAAGYMRDMFYRIGTLMLVHGNLDMKVTRID